MFKQIANTLCKNILFNRCNMKTQHGHDVEMHSSMRKLYEFVRARKLANTPSEVARLLGATPQTLKNWETRGISQQGANTAQSRAGCNANWLLGTSEIQTVDKGGVVSLVAAKAEEPRPGMIWPFVKVSVAQYDLLTAEEKMHLEAGILMAIKNRGHPIKQQWPAYTERTGTD